MDIGFFSYNTEYGIRADDLARELETRGFDSLWVGEHTHIPASRETPFPGGGDLPHAPDSGSRTTSSSCSVSTGVPSRLRRRTGTSTGWRTQSRHVEYP